MAKSKTGKAGNKVSTTAVTYNGPIRTPNQAIPNDDIVVRVSGSFATANGGVNGLVLSASTIQVKDTPDWSSYAATYTEYRVLGMQILFLPHYIGGSTAVVQGAGAGFSVHNTDTAVLPTLQEVIQHADWKPFHSGREYKAEWKMSSTEEADFISTTSPSSVQLGQLYAVAPNATSTISYGIAILTYVVQFRDRR